MVEHDASNPSNFAAATAAHNIFNVCKGISFKENQDEIRKFKPVDEWIAKVEESDLQVIRDADGSPIKRPRDGDPSLIL